MPHKPTEFRTRGTSFKVGPHLIRQLSSDHEGDGVHDLQWNTNGSLGEAHIVAACPFGGPIARASRVDGDYEKQIDNMIHIFSSTGDPLIDHNSAYNKVNKGNLVDPEGNPNYQPIIIADIGRHFDEAEKTNATIVYMCWDDNDTLLVCLSNGMVWAFTSTGTLAAPAPLTVPGAYLFQTLEYGVAMITRRNTAVFVYMNANVLTKIEEPIDIPPGGEVVSFAAIPKNRFPAKIVDRVVGGSKVPMRMENATHELIIAAATPDIEEPCDIYLASFNSDTGKARCFQLDIDRSRFPKGNIVSFAVAPHKARIALITEFTPGKDNVFACSSDFKYIHCIGCTQTEVIPSQLFWLGDEIVGYSLLTSQFDYEADFKTAIVMMPYPGDQHSFNPPSLHDAEESAIVEVEISNMPTDAYIIPEATDSIRVLSSDTFQIVQVVPQEIRAIFEGSGGDSKGSIPSTLTTANLLALAYDEYAAESPNCVEFINAVMKKSGELDIAIDQLVTAASFELDVEAQKRLLRVANFGKTFSNTYVTDNFVNVCRRLRVLQCLRSIGTLLTFDQLAVVEDTRLTQRLASHQHFQLAFEFADVLNLSVTPILTIWAKHLLASIPKQNEATPHDRQAYFEIILDMILGKFELNRRRGDLPYVTVAHHAYKYGRANNDELYLKYARRIVSASPSARSKFDALLLWGYYEDALQVAVPSGDANMIFMVLSEAIEGRSEAEIDNVVIPLLNAVPESAALLRNYVRALSNAPHLDAGTSAALLMRQHKNMFRDTETMLRLDDYFSSERAVQRAARSSGTTAMQIERSCGTLRDASRHVEEALRNERGGAIKLMHSHSFLIDKQVELAGKCGNKKFLNASVVVTIQLCFEHNRTSDALELSQYFGVSEKTYAYAKLRAYVATENWDELDKLAAQKKSPIPPDAFVKILMDAGDLRQATRFVPRLQPITRRMDLYVFCGDWKGACEDCLRSRDDDMLVQLRKAAKTESALADIDAVLRKAGK